MNINVPPTTVKSSTSDSFRISDVTHVKSAVSEKTTPELTKKDAQPAQRDAIKAEKHVSDWLSKNTNLQFSVDDQSGTRVVRLIDSSTQEVIRQIPSEEMIRIAEGIDKFQESGKNAVKGLLLKQDA